MKNVLNVIVDILTLMAICVAAIGHVLPWFDPNRIGLGQPLADIQAEHAERSGIALGVLAGLVCLSLLFNWGPAMRRLLNLAMFVSAFSALLLELMIFSGYSFQFDWLGGRRLQFNDTAFGYPLAMIPTCVAVFLCLLRMLWTMPPTRPVRVPSPAELDRKPPMSNPLKEAGFAERKELTS